MAGVGALCRASLSAESAEGLGTFVAKRKAVVRAGAELDSPVVTNLEKGNVIIAQEMKVVGSVVRVRYDDGWVSMSSTKTSNMLLQPLEHLSLGQLSFGGAAGSDLPVSGGSISEEEGPSRSRPESPTGSASPQRSSPVGGLMDVRTLAELDITSLDEEGEASRASAQKVGESGLGRSGSSDDLTSSKQRRSSNSGEGGTMRKSGSSSDLLSSKRRSGSSRERRSVNGRERREGPPTMSFTFDARKGKDGKPLPLGIGWALRTSDHAAQSGTRQSRVGDDRSGEVIVQEIRPGHLAAMYAEQGLSEGLVLLEIQQVSVVGKSYPEFLELVTKHMDVRPLTLKFRHDDEENQEEQQAAAFSVIPFAIRASQVSDLWSIKYGSQLDGIGDTAEKVVVIQDVTAAHTTVYKGQACTLQPGMVLQGVSGQPVAGRTYSDVMGMIYEAFIRSQIEHRQEMLAEEFASQEADTLIREMGSRGKQLAPPAPPTPVATPDGEKLIRPAPPRPYRMCNGELVALPATSAGSYVLEFEAVGLPSLSSSKHDSSTLAPRILKQQRLIEVTSKEPLGIDLVEVEFPRGAVVVVGHLDYSSKATRKLEDQGLGEGMVLCEVNGIPVVSAAAAEAAEDSGSDETPPYTLSDVVELFKNGLRPLVLSFEGEFDEDSEDNQLVPRLVDPKLDLKTPVMQKTFDVKRGSMSKMLKLRVGDMGIQVETKDSRDDLPSWDSFLFKNLEMGKVQVRGRKLYIRSGRQAPPVILTCVDNQAKEIQQLVDIKIRELRKADRYEKLRAKKARSGAVQLQQQSPDGSEEDEKEPEPELELESQPQSDGSATMHTSAGEEHRQERAHPQRVSRQKSLDQANRDPASGTPLGTIPPVMPLKLVSLSPTVLGGQASDSPRLSTSPFVQHTTPRSLGEMVALAESSRQSTDSTGSGGTPRVGSLGTGSASVGSPRLSPHRTPPSATAAAVAANGNGWSSQGSGDYTHAQKPGWTVSGGTDSQGQATPPEGVPPSPTCVSSRFPALSSIIAEWVASASNPANKSLYDVPDFEQPRLLATKMRLCATTVADITARALEEKPTSGRIVGASIVAVAEAYVADVIWPALHAMLRDIKDFVSVRNKLNQEITGAIATPWSNGNGSDVVRKCSLFELGVHLLASHLIRPVAPTVEDFFDDSDEEDSHEDSNDGFDYSAPIGSRGAVTLPADPRWPTLSLVYEFAYRFFMSHDISAEDAEEMLCPDPTTTPSDAGQGRRLLCHLVPLLEYAGEEERAALIRLLKLLVNRFGSTKNKRVVKLLLQSTGSACVTLAYDSTNLSSCGYGRHRGLSEILELALTLIGRWRAPLLAYQQQFVICSLGALHTLPVERLRGCHEALKECQFTAIDKAGADGGQIAASLLKRCLLRRWPRQSVEKQELFLEEMEGLLPHVPPAELLSLGGQLGAILDVCLRSPHVEPVLGALYLITAEKVEDLFSDAAAEAAPERCSCQAEGITEQPAKALTGLAALVAEAEMGIASGAEREIEAGDDTQKPVALIGKQAEELFDMLQESLKALLSTPDVAHWQESQNRQIIEMAQDASDMLSRLNDASDASTHG